MLLDRIDIDAHGPLHHVELGPFAEHLNVVIGPRGSGKTAIARFVRDSLVGREYPQGMLSASTGRVVWADRNGLVHCRREQDGTHQGRRTVEFESRGDLMENRESQGRSWFRDLRTSTESSRAVQSIQLPESIVDGVITDTAITSVARVVSACVRSGLDSPELYRSLPLQGQSNYHSHDEFSPVDPMTAGIDNRDYDRNRRLRGELAEVEAELARLDRRDAAGAAHPSTTWLDPNQIEQLNQLHDQARRLRARQSELQRWIAEIDRALHHNNVNETRYESPQHSYSSQAYRYHADITDQNLRSRLDDLNAQMIRWRRALAEIRGLREMILSDEFRNTRSEVYSVDDPAMLRRRRMDGFLWTIDHYGHRYGDHFVDHSTHDQYKFDPAGRDFYPAAFRPIHQIDDIEYRIESATRQIDWLLKHYADPSTSQSSWFQPTTGPVVEARNHSLGETLRQVRGDLDHLRSYATRIHDPAYRADAKLDELARDEQWLIGAMDQLNRHRETLLHQAARNQDAETSAWADHRRYDNDVLYRDRRQSQEHLDRVAVELDACLRQAAEVRRAMRTLPIIDDRYFAETNWRQPDLVSVDRRLETLRRRRAEILEQLRVGQRPIVSRCPLSDAASGWLVRLTGGRLRRVSWPYNRFRGDTNSYHRHSRRHTGVSIDGRDELECSATDRAIAALAVRMAAGDLLARTGRHVPLVLETNGDRFDSIHSRYRDSNAYDHGHADLSYWDNGELARSNDPIASALRDYSRGGRQIVLLTSNQSLADQLTRVGARTYELNARPIIHAHRPLWKPHYQGEHYVGPHPHTYGHGDVDDLLDRNRHFQDFDSNPIYDTRPMASDNPVSDINRNFDMAWRETYGVSEDDQRETSFAPVTERTDWSRDGYRYRDGYYATKSYTTQATAAQGRCDEHVAVDENGHHPHCCQHQAAPKLAKPKSPFFLTVDSPIDQAPSIDAVAAARLRGLKVTHINHLMQQDSNRLADALGLASVDASTIRRWQSECRLVCRVPQLRGFDARVLVGCGVTTPAQLAAIHPVDLLQQVEAFLATDQGQKILLSGSSHELSRITSWIAAANSSDLDHFEHRVARQQRSFDGRTRRAGRATDGLRMVDLDTSDHDFDSARYEYDENDGSRRHYSNGVRRQRTLRTGDRSTADRRDGRGSARRSSNSNRSSASRVSGSTNGRRSRSGSGSGTGRGRGFGSGSGSGSSRTSRQSSSRSSSRRSSNRSEREPREFVRYDRGGNERDYENRSALRSERSSRSERSDRSERSSSSERETELRFYLHRESPVVDAPSIGARMAERLNAVGIETVDDLLRADSHSVASELDHRRVDADTVLQWQQQATLVCRVPMLRGHDAQLLVAAEITTPEALAECDADELFGIIDPIARSGEGKRIIRGGKLPDLEEVTDWIRYGNQHRELMAA